MEKETKSPNTPSDDLPPVKNYPLYIWRVIRKLAIIAFYCIACALIAIIVFPVMRLFLRDRKKFRKAGHHFISCASEFFVRLMSWAKSADFDISAEDLKKLRDLRGCVVIANHPSLLDTMYLIAFLRNTECIVKADLMKGWSGGIVKALYIVNNIDFDIMKDECCRELKQGATLIIFPEGTRSPAGGMHQFKKGAARIALAAGANVQPVHIGGNRKYGLGKGEPMWKVHPTERYKYEFKLLPQIDVSKYKGLSETLAAKHLTDDMRAVIEG